MGVLGQLIPLAVLAVIVTLVVRPLLLRGTFSLGPPRPRPERKRKVKLKVVRSRMDDDLNDLLKRG